jgi:Uma2 family endonuclease
VDPATIDQRVFLHGVSWAQYEALLAVRGDDAGPRMTYLEGELELMSPSRDHESIKTLFARLLEIYALVSGTPLEGYGSMTMKSRPRARGAEPDECYAIGGPKKHPDLAIEVVWTHGGIDKLEVYRGLGVREVWIYRDSRLELYALRRNDYVRITKSAVLPELDLRELLRHLDSADQTSAVKRYYRTLQKRMKPARTRTRAK